jgi:hypothetical protein
MDDLIKHLLCDGLDRKCKTYQPLGDHYESRAGEHYDQCVWYTVIRDDLDKIERGDVKHLTFGGLEKLIP